MSDGTPTGSGHVVGRATVGGKSTQPTDSPDAKPPTTGDDGSSAGSRSTSEQSKNGPARTASTSGASAPSKAETEDPAVTNETTKIQVPSAFGGNNGSGGKSGKSVAAGSTTPSSGSAQPPSTPPVPPGAPSVPGKASAPVSPASQQTAVQPAVGASGRPMESPTSGASPSSNLHFSGAAAPTSGQSGGGLPFNSGPAESGGGLGKAVRNARSTVQAAAARGPRRARLQLRRVDPWSVLKFSLSVSAVLTLVFIVATIILYLVLAGMGVFDSINEQIKTFTANPDENGGGGIDLTINALGVILGAIVLGVINTVLFTALSTIGAFIYNVCADLVGGVEVTLAERD